nr:nonstructural protein NS4A [Hepacivirus macronycteridis]
STGWVVAGASIAAICLLTEASASICITGIIRINDGKIFISQDRDNLYTILDEMEEC